MVDATANAGDDRPDDRDDDRVAPGRTIRDPDIASQAGGTGGRSLRRELPGARWRALGRASTWLDRLGGLGPRPQVIEPDPAATCAAVPALDELEPWLERTEGQVPALRPGTAARIRWHAEPGRRTPLALVYLHGFSASGRELSPVVERVAGRLGANAYFARLRGHGRDGRALLEAQAGDWLADALQAMAIGAQLGERVAVIGTSTGATIAMWLAVRAPAAQRPAAQVWLSPNLGLRDSAAELLLWPWMTQLVPRVVPEHAFVPRNEAQARYWTTRYPTAALAPMMALVDLVRGLDWTRLEVPTLALVNPDDPVTDTATALRYLGLVEAGRLRVRPISPLPGEDGHVIAGDVCAPSRTPIVVESITHFLRDLELAGPDATLA